MRKAGILLAGIEFFCSGAVFAQIAKLPESRFPPRFSPDGAKVVIAAPAQAKGIDSIISECSVRTGECRTVADEPRTYKNAVYSPDGRYLAVTDLFNSVSLYETEGYKLVFRKKFGGGEYALAFSPDGQFLAVSNYNDVTLARVSDGMVLKTLPSGYGRMGVVCRRTDGFRYQVTEIETDSPAEDAGFKPGDVVMEADGNSIFFDDFLKLLASRSGVKIKVGIKRGDSDKILKLTPVFSPLKVWDVAFSSDGKYLWAQNDKGYTIWNTADYLVFDSYVYRDDAVYSETFNPVSRDVIIAGKGGKFNHLRDVPCPDSVTKPSSLQAWFASTSTVVTAQSCGYNNWFLVWRVLRGAADIVAASDTVKDAANLSFSPDGGLMAFTRNGATEIHYTPLQPYRFVSTDNAALTGATGKTLTTLPKGTMVMVKKEMPAHSYVTVNATLAGYLANADISFFKPDIMKPVVRVMEKSFDAPDLHIRGVVYDDSSIKQVTVAGKTVAPANFKIERGNYTDAFPFDVTVTVTPDMEKAITATDASGKTTTVPVNIDEPAIDYVPAYAQVRTTRAAAVRKTPEASGESFMQLKPATVLVALGGKDGWYYLEGGGWLNQTDAKEVEIYARPAQEAVLVADVRKPSGTKIVKVESEIDENIPVSADKRPDAVAVVIGVKDYKNTDVPTAEYALRDAATVKEYLVKTFGFNPANVLFLKNPSKGDFERVFGSRDSFKGELFNYIRPGKSDVFVYYSGHGAPDPQNKNAYFVPSDANPDYVRLNGYPLDLFYANLAQLPAKSMTVVIDACFSGGSHKGMLIKQASPLVMTPVGAAVPLAVNLFASSSGDEMSSWLEEKGHSLFTYYFLRGVQERFAKSGSVSTTDLRAYLSEEVPFEARKRFGRVQTPQFSGSAATLLAK